MWIVCGICWGMMIVLLLRERKTWKAGTEGSGKKAFFDRLADGFLSYPVAAKIFSGRVQKHLKQLYPAQDTNQVCKFYYRGKLSLIMKVLIVGIHIITLISYSERISTFLTEGNKIIRNSDGTETVVFWVESGNKEYPVQEISYDVQSKKYTETEIQQFCDRFLTEYETLICGENESLREVKKDLVLKTGYVSYPMEFAWTSSHFELLDEDGTVRNEELDREQMVSLTVEMTYEELVYEHTFSVCVCPAELSKLQEWQKEIMTAIRKADEQQRFAETLLLPEQISGVKVHYSSAERSNAPEYLLCLVAILFLLFYAKDNDLKKAVMEKSQRLSLKYPEFISKFQLLLGAGMTVRTIFWKICEDASLGEELRQELQLLVRDIKNGMSVSDALDRFGKRTANPLYIKFAALLIQNLKKGTQDLLSQLSEEAEEAFALRKTHAKQLGEEAGTKLLVPMILMLAIVMAVLMLPAFLSFQF